MTKHFMIEALYPVSYLLYYICVLCCLQAPNMDAKIVDEHGKSLPPGKDNVGEICMRGPNIMKVSTRIH